MKSGLHWLGKLVEWILLCSFPLNPQYVSIDPYWNVIDSNHNTRKSIRMRVSLSSSLLLALSLSLSVNFIHQVAYYDSDSFMDCTIWTCSCSLSICVKPTQHTAIEIVRHYHLKSRTWIYSTTISSIHWCDYYTNLQFTIRNHTVVIKQQYFRYRNCDGEQSCSSIITLLYKCDDTSQRLKTLLVSEIEAFAYLASHRTDGRIFISPSFSYRANELYAKFENKRNLSVAVC